MKLDGLVAALDHPLGELAVILGGGETIDHLVATHRRAVSGNFVAIAAQHLPNGCVTCTAGEIPERHFGDRQCAIGEVCAAASLPLGQINPQSLPVQRVLAHENLLHEVVDHVRTQAFGRAKRVSGVAII